MKPTELQPPLAVRSSSPDLVARRDKAAAADVEGMVARAANHAAAKLDLHQGLRFVTVDLDNLPDGNRPFGIILIGGLDLVLLLESARWASPCRRPSVSKCPPQSIRR